MAKKISNPINKIVEEPLKTITDALEIAPRRPGRPPKYRADMCDTVIRVAKKGGFHAAMMLACGVSETQFYEWKNTIPEFKEAVNRADDISLAILEKILTDSATGGLKNSNFSAVQLLLQNKYKALYSRINGSGGDSHEITINNNTINLTSEQVTQKITQKLEKMKRLGFDVGVITPPRLVIEGETDAD